MKKAREKLYSGLAGEALGLVEAGDGARARQADLRQAEMVEYVAVAFAVLARGDGDMPEHLPFDAVLAALQTSRTIALEPGAAEVAQQAGGGGGVEQDEAGGACQALRQAAGVVAFDDPAVARKRRIVQREELVLRARPPIGIRQMIKQIQLNRREAARPRDRRRQGGLAAVGRPHEADARSKIIQGHGATFRA